MGLASSMGMRLSGSMEWDYLNEATQKYGNEATYMQWGTVAYLCEQCRPQVGAVSTGNLCGTAHKLLCESHKGNKLGGNKVLHKASLEENM